VRIGLISDCYHPTKNGVTGMVALQRAGFAARGHEVMVVAPRSPDRTWGDAPACDRGPDVATWSLPLLPSIRLRLAPTSSRRLGRELDRFRPDVIHTHTEGPLALAARRAASARGIPTVHTLHTFYEHYLHYVVPHGLDGAVAQRLLRAAMARAIRGYDRIVAPSARALEVAASLAPSVPRTLVPNGVALAPGVAEPHVLAGLRRRLGIGVHDRLVLSVGRIAPEKRSAQLFDALRPHLSDPGDLKVALVGGGPLLHDLRDRAVRCGIADRIVLPGYLPHQEVLALYRLASVYVTASLSENHPLTLLEAAAAGLPLVARDDGSRTGPVVDGHTGVLADDDDELVAEAIRIGRDPVRRERLGAAARSMAAVHTDQVHLDRMERLYRELLAARAPNRHPAPSAHR
jgi:1,2-diacylglycerol 3-alpha-glucosyltransferase